jgi:hypothetical protein
MNYKNILKILCVYGLVFFSFNNTFAADYFIENSSGERKVLSSVE